MSVFENRKEELEKHEFMLGQNRGRLAVSLDILTDAITLVGMHAVYCRSSRFPNQPKLDIEQILKQLDETKELISSVMTDLKKQKQSEQNDSESETAKS